MAPHDYQYKLRLDSEGSGTLISTWGIMQRLVPEQNPGLRLSPTPIANSHGDAQVGRVFFNNYDFQFEILLDYGAPATTSKVYENRSEVVQRMSSQLEDVWLQRNTAYQGDVEIPFRVIRPPGTSNPDNLMRFTCRTMQPFWRDQAVTFSAVDPESDITHTGDAPISDLVIALSGHNGTQRLTNTTTGDYVQVNDDTTSNAITITCDRPRIVKQSGAHVDDASNFVAANPWFMEIVPGLNEFTLSGSGSATVTAREKWL